MAVNDEKQGEVKLIGLALSPFVLRTRIALNLKGVQYEFLLQKPVVKSELAVKHNPAFQKLPILLHNGRAICESMVICEYIDKVWPVSGTAFLPADPYELSVQQFWTVFVDDKFVAGLRALKDENKEARVDAVERLFDIYKLLEEAFEKCSKGKAFFNGDNIGYLDLALGGFMGWIRASEKLAGVEFLDETKFPLLAGWAERFRNHEAVKELIPETDKIVEFATTNKANW